MIRVAQLGARMHYAVPRMLAEAGALESLHTDLYARGPWASLPRLPITRNLSVATRLRDRWTASLPPARVMTHPVFGLEYYWRQQAARTVEEKECVHLWAGKKFAELAGRGLKRASAVYGFNSASLEFFEEAGDRGVTKVLEMTIAPREVEARLVEEGGRRWPAWRLTRERGPAWYASVMRERQEWRLADKIICGSPFVRDSLGECGGPIEKCEVVRYGVALPSFSGPKQRAARPLRVLTAGALSIRKGTPVVLDAARELPDCEFKLAGAGSVPQGEVVPSNVEVVGSVPRSSMASLYDWADVFLLPSLCEGSATVTYEALGHGLPVICTPNTGAVVRSGVDGFVVPLFDSKPIVDRLRELANQPVLLEHMSESARATAEHWDLTEYSRNLCNALQVPVGVWHA